MLDHRNQPTPGLFGDLMHGACWAILLAIALGLGLGLGLALDALISFRAVHMPG